VNSTEEKSNGRQLPVAVGHSAQVAAIAEAEKIKCLFLAAMQCPRNIAQAKADILEACQDRDLAEEALYSYRRASQIIEGPSIDLVTEIATIWGRIDNGWEVVEEGEGKSKVRTWACDLQSLHPVQRTFWVKHVGMGGKVLTESRDIYEMIANLAQRRMRSCIEALIPKHILNAAVRQVKETLTAGQTDPLEKRAPALVARFHKSYGVTEAQIEKFIGSKVSGMTETQYVRLIAIAKSLRDGAPVTTFFDVKEAKIEPDAKPADDKKAEEKKPANKGGGKKPAAEPPKPADGATSQPQGESISPTNVQSTATDTTPAPPPELQVPGDVAEAEVVNEGDDWSSQFGG
jgi:hypothetical protein